jgi:hypothetical protein
MLKDAAFDVNGDGKLKVAPVTFDVFLTVTSSDLCKQFYNFGVNSTHHAYWRAGTKVLVPQRAEFSRSLHESVLRPPRQDPVSSMISRDNASTRGAADP